MTETEGRAVRELIDAFDNLRTAMYNSDLELSWTTARERFDAALEAVEALPGVPQT